ncbi:MAG: hypothetical protein A3C81_03060 [Candidatus Yanofskybacteria bacterium RIFCSPHIGHO2_02_FULL_46_19]|uniref:Uncharacterized protein n=2 Tax=Candidatus Yanofskyibacteriota TaxID=1752733 RepID=A0A1F8H6F8_9BACT|nr:MAG: hypothetical protein A3C81_03060 [Candidatus Yanofskybacteria bacterium RIFCSPHIGHO2_02_FULL_46_19]OGN27078.1 MAG: hypothetical protein A3B17_02105 [Candidatus Yanofskybacteria bacterium RIFCSPLOWO2_01_FULL_45_72]OGN32499.1 MAG: hypothetical protein A3J01_02685 [Candidatus Yanofskybacteria bacterium RIFCSPLOWO2_02_FULL_45_18]
MNLKIKIICSLFFFLALGAGTAGFSFAQYNQTGQTDSGNEINLYSILRHIPNGLEGLRGAVSGGMNTGEVVSSGGFNGMSGKDTMAIIKVLTVFTIRLSIITLSISTEILKAFLGFLIKQ